MNDEDVALKVEAAYDQFTAPDSLQQVLQRGARLRRARNGRRAGTAIGAVALTTFVAVNGLPAGRAPQAFAAWTARPTIASAAQATQVLESCRAQLPHDASKPPGDLASRISRAPDVLDVRGAFAVALWDDGDGTTQCARPLVDGALATEGGEFVSGSIEVTKHSEHRVSASAGAAVLSVESVAGISFRTRQGVVVQGWVGARVARVELRWNGEDIEASVSHGMFAAWWPLPDSETVGTYPDKISGAATAYDAGGHAVAVVPFASPSHPAMGIADADESASAPPS